MSKLSQEDIKILEQARKLQNENPIAAQMSSQEPQEAPERDELFLTLNNLPSMGKFYNGPVKAQPLKVMDTIILSNVTNDNYVDRYSEIFSKRIIGIDPKEMFSIDQDYILIWLRENSFPGYTYKAEPYKCSECQRMVAASDFYYDQFTFESNADEIENESFIVELESGLRIEMRMRRRYHDILVDNYIQENFTNIGQKVSKEEKELLKLAAVLNIEGCGDIEERADYIEHKLKPSDFVELLAKLKENNMRCKIGAQVECPHCGASNNASFFFRARLFLPNYQAKRPSQAPIQPVEDQ